MPRSLIHDISDGPFNSAARSLKPGVVEGFGVVFLTVSLRAAGCNAGVVVSLRTPCIRTPHARHSLTAWRSTGSSKSRELSQVLGFAVSAAPIRIRQEESREDQGHAGARSRRHALCSQEKTTGGFRVHRDTFVRGRGIPRMISHFRTV